MKKGKSFFTPISIIIIGLLSITAYPADIDLTDKSILQLQQNQQELYLNKKPPPGMTQNENAIDPDHYFVGGGDEFFISVIGQPSISYTVSINLQGDLYIPELGLLSLGKITLTEAQKSIAEFIGQKLKKQDKIYVQLTKAKTSSVTVNGAVANAGTYILPGTARILDAIRTANNQTIPSLNYCNFREILCRNKDSTVKIDLFNYLLKNDITGNPFLYPGDNITLLLATKTVFLNTATKSGVSEWIPIKENETLSDFLSFIRFNESVDSSQIYYQTRNENGFRSTKTISWNDAGSIVLHDKDVITIPEKKNYSGVFLVSVGGEVARPGTYPIIRDSSSVQDLLAMAGGPTLFADMDRAVILRNIKTEQEKIFKVQEKIQETKSVRPEMLSGLEKMSTSLDYSILELKRSGIAAKLVENDRIYVPLKDKFVYISGNVNRPGIYEYVAGKKVKYYIDLAGGYNGKASKTNIFGIRYYEKASQQTNLSEILAGDVIVVPESLQGKMLTTVLIPIFGVVLSAIGVILTIYVNTK